MRSKISKIGASFIVGGALGNFTDRIRLGYVIDYIDFHVKSFNFPVFNFADVAIFIGSIVLM